MPADPDAARQFAVTVVQELRGQGFEALWAGGCVRDQLLGLVPKDYDVATSATPDEVRSVFGRRRTIAIGASFGVITVLGPKSAGQVEVATFRKDAAYSDGRHPDHVVFSNAREDAQRRDFTVNGLFLDPVRQEVIDFVGGQRDIEKGVIRAIGDPHQRIEEDKLRMLRAVRFAAIYGFDVEARTFEAVCQRASEISVVSAERITDEFRRMLHHARRRTAAELLQATGLLAAVLPELRIGHSSSDTLATTQTLEILDHLDSPSFPAAFATLLRSTPNVAREVNTVVEICRRWKLSKDEMEATKFCLEHERLIRSANPQTWVELQPVLVDSRVDSLLTYAAAVAVVVDSSRQSIDYCRERLALPAELLDPQPLISGNDLQEIGIPPGPAYRTILQSVRNAQLAGEVLDSDSARSLAVQLWNTDLKS